MKRKFIILLSALIFSITGMAGSPDGDSPVTGYLDITVESNVNKVLFSYPISNRNLASENSNGQTRIVLPVREFECKNKIAFKDFLTLLKADQYPEMVISIPENVIRQLEYSDTVTLKNVTITIAGVSRKYDIYCVAERDNGDKLLSGTIRIDLTDLDILPPSKYFGMVKIKDEVIVKFGLGLKDQNYARK